MNGARPLPPEQDAIARIGAQVSRETLRDLQRFVELFQHWNKTINLVSESTVGEVWQRHIEDSLQLLPMVNDVKIWADLGSGGGFPGLVVAICLRGTNVHLVESNRKKAAFLQAVIGSLALSTRVHACRIEQFSPGTVLDVVSARALANVSTLFNLSEHLLSDRTRAFFLKGRDYRHELKESRDDWQFDLIEHRSRTESQSAVLEFTNVARRPK